MQKTHETFCFQSISPILSMGLVDRKKSYSIQLLALLLLQLFKEIQFHFFVDKVRNKVKVS